MAPFTTAYSYSYPIGIRLIWRLFILVLGYTMLHLAWFRFQLHFDFMGDFPLLLCVLIASYLLERWPWRSLIPNSFTFY